MEDTNTTAGYLLAFRCGYASFTSIAAALMLTSNIYSKQQVNRDTHSIPIPYLVPC